MHAQLEIERNARIALEQRVQILQDDISNLHLLVNKLIASGAATSPSYPTPSPDMLILSSEDSQRMNCSTPRAHPRNEDNFYRHSAQHEQQGWRNDSESVYSEDLAQSNADGVASPDEWITPKEEGFTGSGFFRHADDHGVRTYAST